MQFLVRLQRMRIQGQLVRTMKNIMALKKSLGAIHKARIAAKWAVYFWNEDALTESIQEMHKALNKLSLIISGWRINAKNKKGR